MRVANDSNPATSVTVGARAISIKTQPVSAGVLKRHHLITADPDDDRLFPYKVLRTRIWREMQENKWSSLAVTSAKPGEGKTVTAINLGISLAMMGEDYTVIVIDLDMRRPNVSKCFEIVPQHGIADYLRGEVTIDEVLIDPGIARLLILPGNKAVSKSSELLSSRRLSALFQELKAIYPASIVIVDLPPLLSTDDVLVVLPHVDTSVLVVEDGKTGTDELSKAVSILQQINFLGTVLNKVDVMEGNYY
ncbi:MAG: exopolysaccharide biosynthesis related tyrosine-protein kinase [Gammaproteobacteria bacterium]|nr:MAG: exopolysaccharide biosynthesis related tyrosine-protein kinase [Gammaproteobacteria bacterium]TND05337.1 MAG: exopolysaccharide biosynthesis related tyrosine-protein kinase [Gammaproteobacteria bacterium]